MTSPIEPQHPSQMPPARPHGHGHGREEYEDDCPIPQPFEVDLDFPSHLHVTHTHELGHELAGILRQSLKHILEPMIMATLADVLPNLLKAFSDQQAALADLRKQVADATANAGMPSTQEQGFADQISAILDAMDPTKPATLPTDGGTTPTPPAPPAPPAPVGPTDTGAPVPPPAPPA